jgi:hypothetical protein
MNINTSSHNFAWQKNYSPAADFSNDESYSFAFMKALVFCFHVD